MSRTPRLVGRFLGTVVDNQDPKNLCRVRVQVPEVFGEEATGWCVAAAPYAGSQIGLAAIPPVGALVFVEWPAGDTTRTPIWSGSTWADGDGVPGAGPDLVVLVTPAGHRIELDGTSGAEKVSVTAAGGAAVVLDQNGVMVTMGGQKIAVTNASISINDGALEVR